MVVGGRMNGKELIHAVKDHVATITMNRPEVYNALTIRRIENLLEMVSACEEDREVRVLVLTGAGPAFCAGGDVKEFAEHLETISQYLRRLLTSFHGAISRMNRMSKPVIAAVNGVAAGAGMSLAMACDMTVAADWARFTMAYSKIGATPDGSSTYFLPRLVGVRRALELTYTNRVLTAREAEAWGLVNRGVPGDPDGKRNPVHRSEQQDRRLPRGGEGVRRKAATDLQGRVMGIGVLGQIWTSRVGGERPLHIDNSACPEGPSTPARS